MDRTDRLSVSRFRSVYAAVLEDWMGTPSRDILGRSYRKASILRPRP